MKRMMIIFMVVIGFCFGLLAQPEIFRQSYYDSLKTQKSKKAERLLEYKQKFREFGLPERGKDARPWNNSDLFFHDNINLEAIEKYKELGIDIEKLSTQDGYPTDLLQTILRYPVIITGQVIDSMKYEFDEINCFNVRTLFYVKVDQVLKGEYLYIEFPDTVKVYLEGYSTAEEIKKLPYPYNQKKPGWVAPPDEVRDLKIGSECLLLYYKEYIFINKGQTIPRDSYSENVFYKPQGGPIVYNMYYRMNFSIIKDIIIKVNELSKEVWRWKNDNE